MLRYVKLSNYRSLKELSVDFTKGGKPKDFVLIYGENGVGKSNFVNAFETLDDIINTRSNIEHLQKMAERIIQDEKYKEYIVPDSIREQILAEEFIDSLTIIEKNKTIGSTENMVLEYGFQINDNNGVYRIEMDNQRIIAERLEYMLEKNQTIYFNITTDSLSKEQHVLKPSIFPDTTFRKDFDDLLQKYWGRHSLMSILFYELKTTNDGYVADRVNNGLLKVLQYLNVICTKITSYSHRIGTYSTQYDVLANIMKPSGRIKVSDEPVLDVAENLLHSFFTHLYSDIKQVYYKREKSGERSIRYSLFFKKLVYGQLLDVEFKLESSGTKNLFEILPYLLSACDGQIVIIDEIDAGIHDLLMETIFNSVIPDIKGQLIVTTHNTRLMESEAIKDSSIYVFNVDKDGVKELFPITEFGRVQSNHNVRKRYLSGLYGGVPFVSEIDFEEMLAELQPEV
jgi:hypothetical protein